MAKFLNFIKPGYKGPHRKTIRRHVGVRYNDFKIQLKTKLKKVVKIALTTDLWKSNGSKDHLTITGHFFNKSFEYQSTILGFQVVQGQHTSENLRASIKKSLDNLSIETNQIASITTDNASDIKNATSHGFGLRNGCLCHILNLVVQNGLRLWTNTK